MARQKPIAPNKFSKKGGHPHSRESRRQESQTTEPTSIKDKIPDIFNASFFTNQASIKAGEAVKLDEGGDTLVLSCTSNSKRPWDENLVYQNHELLAEQALSFMQAIRLDYGKSLKVLLEFAGNRLGGTPIVQVWTAEDERAWKPPKLLKRKVGTVVEIYPTDTSEQVLSRAHHAKGGQLSEAFSNITVSADAELREPSSRGQDMRRSVQSNEEVRAILGAHHLINHTPGRGR